MRKLIVNLAPTGMIPTKEMTPHVPVSPQEIIMPPPCISPVGKVASRAKEPGLLIPEQFL